MRLHILIILLFFSCTSVVDNKKGALGKISVTGDQIDNGDFENFLGDFKFVELPVDLNMDSPYWIDFTDVEGDGEIIPRGRVKKYFYSSSDERLNNSRFDQFYYGHLLRFSKDIVGVTFYGTSKDEGDADGYQLIMFDEKGVVRDVLFVAGSRGLFDVDMQLEAKISVDKIRLNRIELDPDSVNDLSRFEGKQKFIDYIISSNGSIEKENETKYKAVFLESREESNFRIKTLE